MRERKNKEKKTALIVATMFCLQCPRAAHTLCMDQIITIELVMCNGGIYNVTLLSCLYSLSGVQISVINIGYRYGILLPEGLLRCGEGLDF